MSAGTSRIYTLLVFGTYDRTDGWAKRSVIVEGKKLGVGGGIVCNLPYYAGLIQTLSLMMYIAPFESPQLWQ